MGICGQPFTRNIHVSERKIEAGGYSLWLIMNRQPELINDHHLPFTNEYYAHFLLTTE